MSSSVQMQSKDAVRDVKKILSKNDMSNGHCVTKLDMYLRSFYGRQIIEVQKYDNKQPC